MKPENHIAYKEWASVEEALARGTYVLTLRKGGIHEKQGKFTVEHREFFLFPTFVHQRESDLAPDVLPFLAETARLAPPEWKEGEPPPRIPIRHYVAVVDAVYIEDERLAHELAGLHPFTRAAVEMRFRYRKPGLWAIVQRLYRLPRTIEIPDDRLYAGCRSWVPLKQALSTQGALAVLSDSAFEAKAGAVRKILSRTS